MLPLSQANRRYGRFKPAPLAPAMMITRAKITQPVVDLRKWCGPIKDQGQEGSCTAHSGTSGGEWVYRKYLSQQPLFSPAYLYAKELQAQGSFPQDAGSDGTTMCEQIIANGFCPAPDDPYVAGNIVSPTPEQDAAAAKNKQVGAYHGLVGSQTALSVLSDPTPWVVNIGFDVYSSFESSEVATTGIYNPDINTEQVIGGHEPLVVGFDIGDVPTLRPAGCPPAMLVQNSWGTGWGWNNSGFFWMVIPVVDEADTDLKVFHLGPPWK